VEVMSSILAGAGVSEKTKNFIDASGLADYTLYFSCQEGVGEFGIKNSPARTQNSIDPIFAPREVHSSQIVTWSLPYTLPFKVMDFLFVIPANVKYYLVGNDADFVNEFLNATEGIKRSYTLGLEQITPEANVQVRLIDTDGSIIPISGVPAQLQTFDDTEVSAVVFTGTNQADFYQKKGSSWQKLNQKPVRIISLLGEKNAAKYAAIFSADDQIYQCNMNKALSRLEKLTEVYGGENIGSSQIGGKLQQLIEHYREDVSSDCRGYLEQNNENAAWALSRLSSNTIACRLQPQSCSELDLIEAAEKLKIINENLKKSCSASLY